MNDKEDAVDYGVDDSYFEPCNPLAIQDPGSMHYGKPRALSDDPIVNREIANIAGSIARYYILRDPEFVKNKPRVASAIDYIKYRTCGTWSPFIAHVDHISESVDSSIAGADSWTIAITRTYHAAWLTPADLQHFDACIEQAILEVGT